MDELATRAPPKATRAWLALFTAPFLLGAALLLVVLVLALGRDLKGDALAAAVQERAAWPVVLAHLVVGLAPKVLASP